MNIIRTLHELLARRRPRFGRRHRLLLLAVPVLGLVALGALGAGDPPGDGQNPLADERLYVAPNSPARRQAEEWSRTRPEDARRMRRIAEQPTALWLGEWTRDIRREVDRMVTTITGAGALPVFVAYNIPARDCGHHSAGGAGGAAAYRAWIRDFAGGIRRRHSIVILEPDALAGMDCLPAPVREERLALMRDAVEVLRSAQASVYIDAGNPRWIAADEMAARLRRAGIDAARGFSLNISNFHGTPENVVYGERLSRLLGGKHFVIDTSRNGVGEIAAENWCNPSGQALGLEPTTQTGHPLVDAYLWIKRPGESDGECGGGPRAGQWWADYALGLSRMAETLAGMMPGVRGGGP
jgi:endoglucanase